MIVYNGVPYMTTGSFAKLVNVSKQTLFHYDKNGVFSPALKLDNGYRYYSFPQLDEFEVIKIFKQLDVPLEDIKSYMFDRTPDHLLNLLAEQKEVISERIRVLQELENWIDTKTYLVKDSANLTFNQVQVEKLAEQYQISYAHPAEAPDKMAEQIASLYKQVQDNNYISPYGLGVTLTMQQLADDVYFGPYQSIYLSFDRKPELLDYLVKPAGNYLTIYHHGDSSTIGLTYQKLLAYIQQQNLTVADLVYEDAVLDETASAGLDQYIFRLSVQLID